jgi:glucans biosynthesis protein
MPDGAGFAGFRYHETPGPGAPEDQADWLAFLGASYFRSSGDGGQYGISARGVAVDTAPLPGRREDFPDFTRFYVGPYRDGAAEILAFLDGESLTGAFRIVARRTPSVVTEVECRIFPRRAIDRLGIAPLTSMFWYSETNKWVSDEYRAEVHDSDGLLLHTGAGERIWRPLVNPPAVAVSAFSDAAPRGFGLMQRDRDFDHYRDDVAFERRPNLWIEPLGDWGRGSVQLVEIPTVREYDDNVVAMWVPERPAGPSDEFAHAYRMHWSVAEPRGGDPDLARCLATRTSKSVRTPEAERVPGNPGRERQYVLDFDGAALEGRDPRAAKVDIALSRGVAVDVGAWPDGNGARRPWRVFFKVLADGDAPVDIRLCLREGPRVLSETWIGQHHPGQYPA